MTQKSSTAQQAAPQATAPQATAPQATARPSRSSNAAAPAVSAATPASTGARSVVPAPKMVTHEAIAKLAFQKWQERGCRAGTEEHDWLEAERELNAR